MNDLVHQATRVEQQLKRNGQTRRSTLPTPQNWKKFSKNEVAHLPKRLHLNLKVKTSQLIPLKLFQLTRLLSVSSAKAKDTFLINVLPKES